MAIWPQHNYGPDTRWRPNTRPPRPPWQPPEPPASRPWERGVDDRPPGINYPQYAGSHEKPWRSMGGYQPPMSGGQPMRGVGTPSLPITSEKWFPELYNLMFGKLQGGQRNIMNQITGNLGRTMGQHLSRTNVAVPVGADALARRYMSPLSQSMEMQDPTRMMGQAQELAKMFAPGFKAEWGEKSPLYQRHTDPTRHLGRYMDRYWGGGR